METNAPTITTIDILGSEWTDEDNDLDQALDQAGATLAIYDQEPDGIIITRYRVQSMTAELRRLVEAAPNARYKV
jgi:hypothetical protein